MLAGLSKQLELTGDDRAAAARQLADALDKQRKALEPRGSGGGGGGRRGGGDRIDALRNPIKARLLSRWPEMSSPYHPATVAALTSS